MTRLLLALALAAGPAAAQGAGPVTWEPLGDLLSAGSLVVLPGPAGDTLVVDGDVPDPSTPTGRRSDYRSLAPGHAEWAPEYLPLPIYPRWFFRTATGALLGYSSAGSTRIDRRDGRTYAWTRPETAPHVDTVYERPSDGALLAGARSSDPASVVVSLDDGRTWAPLGFTPTASDEPATKPSDVYALLEVAGPAGPPRLIAGVANGLAYSDDGGRRWARSDLWGPLRWWPTSVVAVGDTAYAAARDFRDGRLAVAASADGGATWAVRHAFDVPTWGTLLPTPDGTLFLALEKLRGDGPVVHRSTDGGRTWAPASDGHEGYDERLGYQCVVSLALDSAGRLVLAGCTGVWRTTGPVYAVARGAASPRTGPRLRVWPNPAAGRATVEVSGPGPARVAVVDALGREVAVLHDGPLGGPRRLSVATAGWALGLYVVRAVGGGRASTAALAVGR